MDLGDEWTDSVNYRAAGLTGSLNDLGRRTVGAQHHWRSAWYVGDVVDEDDAQGFEVINDKAIVHDLVVAKDRWFEDAGHPVEGLDGLFHTGAEAARRCKNYLVDTHGSSLVKSDFRELLG
jgi:hypothetical protein